MKKIILSVFVLGSASLLSAQAYSFEGGNNQSFYPKASGYMDCAIHIKNDGMENLNLKYKKVSVDFPTTWDFSFCDNVNCITFFADSGTMAPIAAGNNESSMKITVYPNGFADTAVVKYAIWNVNDPNKIDTLVFNINVRWGVSVERINQVVNVFPNPSKGTFQVAAKAEITEIQIFDLMGKKVASNIAIQSNQATIHANNLCDGGYIVKVATVQGVTTSRIVVQN